MKFNLFFFPSLGSGDVDTYDRGNIGNDPDQYRYLLDDLRVLSQRAEELGFHGVYFAEHHFDVEGFEVAHNPLLLNSWVGMHTQRLKLGQLGLVLPSWNPLRLAEDITTMCHMFPQRMEIGFARGFQVREVAPLAAAHQVEGAMGDRSVADLRNRRLFLEHYEILMAALEQDSFSYRGEFNTIPPADLMWPNPATQKYGSGVRPDGVVTELSVVPKLPDREVPPRWQAFSSSEETLRWAAREGMNLAMFELKADAQRAWQEVYVEECAAAGRTVRYGQGIGYLRGMLCLDDGQEARTLDAAMCNRIWGEWFSGTGLTEAFRLPEDDPTQFPLPYRYEMLAERGYNFVGSPDEVTRAVEALVENTHCEHLILQINSGGVPRDRLLQSLETFAEKVMPRFDVERP